MGDFKDVEIIEVLVKEGQTVKKNDSLITLESDKSSVEVPSTHEGKIEKINLKRLQLNIKKLGMIFLLIHNIFIMKW